jgi:hypothetical protein
MTVVVAAAVLGAVVVTLELVVDTMDVVDVCVIHAKHDNCVVAGGK